MVFVGLRLFGCDWRQHRFPRYLRVLAQSAPGIFIDHDDLRHAVSAPTLKFHLRHGELPADNHVVIRRHRFHRTKFAQLGMRTCFQERDDRGLDVAQIAVIKELNGEREFDLRCPLGGRGLILRVALEPNLSADVNLIIAPRDITPPLPRPFEVHCNVINAEGYSPCGAVALTHPAPPQVATTIEEKSPTYLPHCEWVSTGGLCGSASFTPAISVNATPEPAPLVLFGTVILGAFAITKFRS
jgi:hypothetical protein